MPWCETCSKFWTPSSMNADGTCPTCGRPLGDPDAPVSDEKPAAYDASNLDLKELAGDDAKAPWHFKLLVVALVAYLAWRLYEIVRDVVG